MMELTDIFIPYSFMKMPKVSPIENIDYYYLLITDIGFFHTKCKRYLTKKNRLTHLASMYVIYKNHHATP